MVVIPRGTMRKTLICFADLLVVRSTGFVGRLSGPWISSSLSSTAEAASSTKTYEKRIIVSSVLKKFGRPSVQSAKIRLKSAPFSAAQRHSLDTEEYDTISKESRKVTSKLKQLPIAERQRLFNELRSAGKADVYHYSYMIGMCNDSFSAEKLLKEMVECNIRPNIVTFNVVLRKLVEDGKLFRAKKMLYELRQNGPNPDQHTFCTVINGLSRAGRHKCAQQVYQQLCAEPFELDIPSYNTGIGMYCRSGQHSRAEKMMDAMLSCGIQPSISAYTTLISSYGHAGRPDDALRIFDLVKISRDITTYNALIHALTSNGRISEAEIFAQEKMGLLLKSDRTSLSSHTSTGQHRSTAAHSMLSAAHNESCFQGKRADLASQSFFAGQNSQTLSKISPPHQYQINKNSAGQYFADVRSGDGGGTIGSSGGASPEHLPPSLMAPGGAGAFTGDVCTVTSLVDAYGRSGRLDDARHAFQSLSRLGIRPNVQAYTAMISACAFNGRLDEAEHHYVEMLEAGVDPNERTMRVLIDSCENAGDGIAALGWMWEARRRGVRPYSDFVILQRNGGGCSSRNRGSENSGDSDIGGGGGGGDGGGGGGGRGGRAMVKIDLHGMSGPSSLVAVRYALTSWRLDPRKTDVVIVTGQGKHSGAGGPVIGPAVVKFLEEEGFTYSHASGNRGRLVLAPPPGAAPTVALCWLLVALMWAGGCLAAGSWAQNFRERTMEANRMLEMERMREELRRGLAQHARQNRRRAEAAAAAAAAAAAPE